MIYLTSWIAKMLYYIIRLFSPVKNLLFMFLMSHENLTGEKNLMIYTLPFFPYHRACEQGKTAQHLQGKKGRVYISSDIFPLQIFSNGPYFYSNPLITNPPYLILRIPQKCAASCAPAPFHTGDSPPVGGTFQDVGIRKGFSYSETIYIIRHFSPVKLNSLHSSTATLELRNLDLYTG